MDLDAKPNIQRSPESAGTSATEEMLPHDDEGCACVDVAAILSSSMDVGDRVATAFVRGDTIVTIGVRTRRARQRPAAAR
jgi:hypothetical protein